MQLFITYRNLLITDKEYTLAISIACIGLD